MRTITRVHQISVAISMLVAAACSEVSAPPTLRGFRGLAPAQVIADGSGAWTTGPSFSNPIVLPFTGAVNGRYYLASPGIHGTGPLLLEVFDPSTGSWTHKPSTAGRGRGMAAGVGNKFYVVGGCFESDCRIGTTNLLQSFDPATDAWTTLPPMPTARNFGSAAELGGKLYVVGGQGACAPCALRENLKPVLEVYDPATNSWSSKAPMPSPRSFVSAVGVNGKLYVISVDDTPSGFVGALDVYDPATNSWSSATPSPTARGWSGAAAVNGIIYSVSGYTSPFPSGISFAVEAYDPATDSWASVAPSPVGGVYARPQDIGGKLYTTIVTASSNPTTTLRIFAPAAPAPPPPPLPIPLTRAQVGAGALHTCALKIDGTVLCWGTNNFGAELEPPGLSSVAQIVAGQRHTCALKTDGTLACWGQSDFGATTIPPGLGPVAQVSAMGAFTCALKTNRDVACWGYPGFETVLESLGITTGAQVSAGGSNACVLRTDGTVLCWGSGVASNVPAGLASVAQVSAGGNSFACALKTDGTVVCWGNNTLGPASPPAGLGSVVQVSAGHLHTCAVKADGTVVCWGSNLFGQSHVPFGLASVVQVSAGNSHTCVLKSDGTVVCWGSNQTGETTVPTGLNLIATAAAQSIHFTSSVPSPAYVGATHEVSATATSGIDVTFSTTTPAICSVSGSTVSFVAAGNCVVVADQGGNASYLAAPQVTQSINVVRRPQTISFVSTAPTLPLIGAGYAVVAAASSGLSVTITSLTPATCTVAGGTVSLVAAGTCTIAADQAGDATYLAASQMTQSITVITAAQATQNLTSAITAMGLPGGVENSLSAPLNNFNANNVSAACGKLRAFVNQVNAKMKNGQLSTGASTQLIEAARAIITNLGCPMP